jgi:uncharacterized protein DUF5671
VSGLAVSDELAGFVRKALGRGVSRSEIEEVLLRAGWTSQQVRAALAGYAAVEFPIPVPRPRPYLSAREAFMYLVLFSTLYVSAYNLGDLLFEIINRAFPDAASATFTNGQRYSRQAMRWSLASLIVAFPVFLYVSWLVERGIRRDPTKRTSMVRRWLTYLTLFLAATALICDVISLVYYFLGGELTTRFLLKVAVVAAIAGASFWYYLSDLRLEEREDET